MATTQDMLAAQEFGLTDEDLMKWGGDFTTSPDLMFANQEFGLTQDDMKAWGGNVGADLAPDGTTANSMFNAQEAGLTQDDMFKWGGDSNGVEPGTTDNIVGGVKSAMSTVDSWFRSMLGNEGAQKLYASAIMAGATAILQSSKNDDMMDFRNADREDTQAHQKELIADKNKREDEARARKNAVTTRAGLLKQQPNFAQNYQVPGAANTQQYGILGRMK